MSDERDPLEEELASFRPQPISQNLRQRLHERLSDSPVRWRVSWTIGLAAAGVAAAVLWFVLRPAPKPPDQRHAPEIVREIHPDNPPTLQEYRQAFARSPDAMEAMLDRQASETVRWQSASPASVKTGTLQNSSLFPTGDAQ